MRGGGGSCGADGIDVAGAGGGSFFPSVGGGGRGIGALDSILKANCRKN
jgi:hypothetical protein